MDLKGEAESMGVIEPIRLNLQAWGEREVIVARLPTLPQSALLIKALSVRKLGWKVDMAGLELRRNEELAHSDLVCKAPNEGFGRANARRGLMNINIILEC